MSRTVEVRLNFTAETSSAEQALHKLQSSLRNISTQINLDTGGLRFTNELDQASEAAIKLRQNLQNAINTNTNKLDLSKFQREMDKSGMSLEKYRLVLQQIGPSGQEAFTDLSKAILASQTPLTRSLGLFDKLWDTLKRTAGWQISSNIMHGLQSALSDAYDYATTSTYTQGTGSTKYWKNDPEIYWPNDHDKFYFRALAIYNAPAEDGSYNIQAYTPTSSNTVTQATDYVWATTPAHKVKKTDGSGEATYAKSAAITPRTGDVPLAFEHVMSKITVKLATSTAADAVDLSSALLSISKLVDSGTISIEDGTITGGSIADTPISEFCPSGQMLEGKTVLENYTMIPQQITDDAIMTIKLADGTTYKLQLNTCVQDDTTAPITAWLRGIHYTYTITLTKEAISFRVMIKNWDEKEGSGNANLDWD